MIGQDSKSKGSQDAKASRGFLSPKRRKAEKMFHLRIISKKVLLPAALLLLSAAYATASPFAMSNNTTTDFASNNALNHKHLVGITFSQVDLFAPAADERVLE